MGKLTVILITFNIVFAILALSPLKTAIKCKFKLRHIITPLLMIIIFVLNAYLIMQAYHPDLLSFNNM